MSNFNFLLEDPICKTLPEELLYLFVCLFKKVYTVPLAIWMF